MYRRELTILLVLAIIAASSVAFATALFVRRLNSTVDAVTNISVPDFVTTEELVQQMMDNWARLLLIQSSLNAADRLNLIEDIQAHPLEPILDEFCKTPNAPEQQYYFDRLVENRTKFVNFRLQYFTLIKSNNLSDASVFLHSTLRPAFELYRAQVTRLCEVTAKIGRERAKNVVNVSKHVIYVASGLTVLVFFLGIIVGFKTIFEGLAFANRLGRNPLSSQKNKSSA